jgi:hypothetical protein
MQHPASPFAAAALLGLIAACSSAAETADSVQQASSKPCVNPAGCTPPPVRLPTACCDSVDGITPTSAVIHFTTGYGPTPGIVVVVDGVSTPSDGLSANEAVRVTGLTPGAHSYSINYQGTPLLRGTFATPLHLLPAVTPLASMTPGTFAFAIDGVENSLWVAHKAKGASTWGAFDRVSALPGLRDVAVRSLEYFLDVAVVDAQGTVQLTQYPVNGAHPVSFSALGMAAGVPAMTFQRVAIASYIDRDPWDSPGHLVYAVGNDGALYTGATSSEIPYFPGLRKMTIPGAPASSFSSVAAATIPSTGDNLAAAVANGDVYIFHSNGLSDYGGADHVIDVARQSGDNAAFYDVAIAASSDHKPYVSFNVYALSTDGVHQFFVDHDGTFIGPVAGANVLALPAPAPSGMDMRVAALDLFLNEPGYYQVEHQLLTTSLAGRKLWFSSFPIPGQGQGPAFATLLDTAAGDLTPVRAVALAAMDDATMQSPPPRPSPPPPAPPPPPRPPTTCSGGETLTTWVFCQACPAGIAGNPDYLSTYYVPACDKDTAEKYVQGQGTNCEVDDDVCPCDPATEICP